MAPAQPPPTPAHIHAAVVAAFPAVSPRVLKTPLERHLGLSHWANALLRQAWERSHATAGKSVDHIRELWTDLSVWIKWESEQRTGAFKIRGATNKILHEVERARREGRPFPRFVTSSTGNHARACAHVFHELNLVGNTIVLPTNVSPSKLAALQLYLDGDDGLASGGSGSGVPSAGSTGSTTNAPFEIIFHGTDVLHSETHARALADSTGAVYIPPYNDLTVAAGQGTCAVEITRQLAAHTRTTEKEEDEKEEEEERIPDLLYAVVGGGGLMTGIGGFLKGHPLFFLASSRFTSTSTSPLVVGVQPAASPFMHRSLLAGAIIPEGDPRCPNEPTLSDGSAGGIEEGSATFAACKQVVDRWVEVGEDEIRTAMRTCLDGGKVVEGAGAAAVAGFVRDVERAVTLAAGAGAGAGAPQDPAQVQDQMVTSGADVTIDRLRGANVVLVVCGGNIGVDTLLEAVRGVQGIGVRGNGK